MRILVTGGAGYIGSHTVLELAGAGHDLVVVDNLSAGHAWAVLAGKLVIADLADDMAMEALFKEHAFDAVVHFAAHIEVAESVADPLKYYRNNTRNTLALLERCLRFGVKSFVFSSTAAVYGMPSNPVVSEEDALLPINPYGASKMMSERVLQDASHASDLRYVILRYFNAAGADSGARIGEAHDPESHLIPIAVQTALGRRPKIKIFGTDHTTPDGTCVRDYIHVSDLAAAHRAALDHLGAGGASLVLNCGYGHGASVREVIAMVKQVSGIDFCVEEGPRRAGDPPELVADASRIRTALDWKPQYDDLQFIVETAFNWERTYRDGGAGHA
ncbi:MAG: UDP-glucose 4-epimerase GalE [Rhodospirillaceae bacterium]|nr:MAG: UDP-glucose 4-epimerase GalE [Rhodospirillaceae bacterium]